MSQSLNIVTRRSFVRGALALGAASYVFAISPATAFATPTVAELQAQAAAVLDELETMQAELDAASDRYVEAEAKREEAQLKMEEAQKRINEITVRIGEVQTHLGNRARSMYRNGSSTVIDLLLGATSFKAFTNNWELLNIMNENDAELVQESKDLRAEAEVQKAEFAEQERIAAEQAAEALKIKKEAEAVVAEMQATYDSLSAEAAAALEAERAARDAQLAQDAMNNINTNRPSSGSSNAPAYNANTGNAVVDRAYSWVGNASYVWGGCSPGAFDCSGFVSYCLTGSYNRLGSTTTFMNWPEVYDPQPGDVAVNWGHTGIYIGNGMMIHAASPGQGVCVGPVQSGMIFVRY